MHITSLPSPQGIGTLGKRAYAFVDFLRAAGQEYWQVLPMGHTGFCDSPYQTVSAFAGNPYMIDLDMLSDDGLLTPEEIALYDWGSEPERVDFGKLYAGRFELLFLAFKRGRQRDADEIRRFEEQNQAWLPDYSLFMALKLKNKMRPWNLWDDKDIRMHLPWAVDVYRDLLSDDIKFFTYIQFLFFRQWSALRRYAGEKGVRIIGDIPIYVPLDSADVWSSPGDYLLDENRCPTCVAGVPPDYFSSTGQLWGNPIYDWGRMEAEGFPWWSRRIAAASRMFDGIRIDHFRGIESYWAVPFGADDASQGQWRKGPGMKLVDIIQKYKGDALVIAEDLGILTEEVRELLKKSGFPGMAVLQFAFSPDGNSSYLPHKIEKNRVCYTGTHDNPPLGGFFSWMPDAEKRFAVAYLGLNEGEGCIRGFIRGGMASQAELFMAQMQDWLELDGDGRMNIPGTSVGNWRWRALPEALSPELAEKIKITTAMYGRLAEQEKIN